MNRDFSKNEISQNAARKDPKNSKYTIPRTYGVYHLSSSKKSNSTKLFRYGNHPVRMQELQREYGPIKLVALYTHRDNAVIRAAHENSTLRT